jgi:hypothetical protein
VGAGGATGVGIVDDVTCMDDAIRVEDVVRADVIVVTRVSVGDTIVEFTPIQTARCFFSARPLYKPSSQLDPTHRFQRVTSDKAISASEAIFAQLGPVECVSRTNSIGSEVSYSL